MESDSIISIFIPKSWKGLNLPPIELEWKDDVPDSYRDYMVLILVRWIVLSNISMHRPRLVLLVLWWLRRRLLNPISGFAVTMSR